MYNKFGEQFCFDEKAGEKAALALGNPGLMIAASKGAYRYSNPENIVVFNANVCTDKGKIWYGDIDITLSLEKLNELAIVLGTKIYVLSEMDGRFDNAEKPKIEDAVLFTDGENVEIGKYLKDFVVVTDGVFKLKKEKKRKEKRPPLNLAKINIEVLAPIEDFSKYEKGISKEISPLINYYDDICLATGLKVRELNIAAFYLHDTDYETLKKMEYHWTKKYHKLSGYELEKAFNWHWFNIGPNSLGTDNNNKITNRSIYWRTDKEKKLETTTEEVGDDNQLE